MVFSWGPVCKSASPDPVLSVWKTECGKRIESDPKRVQALRYQGVSLLREWLSSFCFSVQTDLKGTVYPLAVHPKNCVTLWCRYPFLSLYSRALSVCLSVCLCLSLSLSISFSLSSLPPLSFSPSLSPFFSSSFKIYFLGRSVEKKKKKRKQKKKERK